MRGREELALSSRPNRRGGRVVVVGGDCFRSKGKLSIPHCPTAHSISSLVGLPVTAVSLAVERWDDRIEHSFARSKIMHFGHYVNENNVFRIEYRYSDL